MTRLTATILTLVIFGSGANAQPRGRPGGQLPLSPGVMPGSPIGPGMQFLQRPGQGFNAPPVGAPPNNGFKQFNQFHQLQPFSPFFGFGVGFPSVYVPFYGFGAYGPVVPYGFGSPYGYGFGYDYFLDTPAPLPARLTDPGPVLANEFPATLTVQFPGPAEVWLNGKQMEGKEEERQLTSPILKPGQSYTFEVKARWGQNGKTYEAQRTVTLGPGEKSRLFVVSGTEVKE